MFSAPNVEKPGYAIAAKEESAGGGAQQQQALQPIETLLAAASAEKGQATAKQCAACHTFEKGGPNRVGPNLYGIVGANKAHLRGLQLFRGDEERRAATGPSRSSTSFWPTRAAMFLAPT